jgi:hypothetical protein
MSQSPGGVSVQGLADVVRSPEEIWTKAANQRRRHAGQLSFVLHVVDHLDAVAHGIREEELPLASQWNLTSLEIDIVLSQAHRDFVQIGNCNRDVIEDRTVRDRAVFARLCFHQVHNRPFAGVEPVAGTLERRPVADMQAHHIDIEIAQSVK